MTRWAGSSARRPIARRGSGLPYRRGAVPRLPHAQWWSVQMIGCQSSCALPLLADCSSVSITSRLSPYLCLHNSWDLTVCQKRREAPEMISYVDELYATLAIGKRAEPTTTTCFDSLAANVGREWLDLLGVSFRSSMRNMAATSGNLGSNTEKQMPRKVKEMGDNRPYGHGCGT